MRLALSPAKPTIDIYQWHDWWAWWPVVCTCSTTGERAIIWRQTIQRRRNRGTLQPECGASDAHWEYRDGAPQ